MKFIKNTWQTKHTVKRILFTFFTVLFLLAVSASAISCKSNNSNNINKTGDDAANGASADVSSTTEEKYIYPQFDGGGADFTFLSPTTTWFYYTDVERDEMDGEVLDDAIYNRNMFIDQQFNINIKSVDIDVGQIYTQIRKVVTAGEDTYDASFCPIACGGNIGSLITSNMFYNLNDIANLNLDQKWWNQTMKNEAAIGAGNKLYYAGCDVDIMTLQSTSCVYFNQDMMTNLGLDLPYNAVRDGKWTLDALDQYMKSGANLNSDASFAWDLNGSSVYGLTSYEDCPIALLAGSEAPFTTTDANGTPHLAIQDEKFINALTKIQQILQLQNGAYLYANQPVATGFHCEPVFKNSRALMVIDELKAADVFRDMNDTFGILPIPKYDETQQNYYCHDIFATPVVVIPVTNSRTDFTGAVLDAMAYVSNRDVTPVFFNIAVSQKQLRNDDSIDMLNIIKDSGSFSVGYAYGWINTLYDTIGSTIGQGKAYSIASSIERLVPKLQINIDNTMALFQ
ncbi:MAG: hypothetical protein FWD71_21090 [Oscillospiraceae bacterium]|nr:hypothetical protein [Oscillospiraceae bacterium]